MFDGKCDHIYPATAAYPVTGCALYAALATAVKLAAANPAGVEAKGAFRRGAAAAAAAAAAYTNTKSNRR